MTHRDLEQLNPTPPTDEIEDKFVQLVDSVMLLIHTQAATIRSQREEIKELHRELDWAQAKYEELQR